MNNTNSVPHKNRPFIKMNGLGNDFVILDGRQDKIDLTQTSAARIASRTGGVGCDQLIVMEQGNSSADLAMRIYNNDGSEVDACGNATRCIAWLLERESAGSSAHGPWTIKTNAGLLSATVDGTNVAVDMGKPKFAWDEIPLAEPTDTTALIFQLDFGDEASLPPATAVNVGNPHCIFFVNDAHAYDLEKIGPAIEHHALFPERTNVELAQIIDAETIRLRVWERGVGITKACGTGACATLPAAVQKGLSNRKATITLDGGDLTIEWRKSDGHIIMTGPTTFDYEGQLDTDLLKGAS